MKKTLLIPCLAILSAFSFTATSNISAHCQIPCGIYSDDTVMTDLFTHQSTILKSMEQINELSKKANKNANQLTRWVMNKEEHANKIQEIMNQYFLAQRLKLSEKESDKKAYLKKLTLIHEIIVFSMKCKQTTDVENAKKLYVALNAFEKAYTGK